MNVLLRKIKYLLKDGFFHILGSTFINKIIAFLTNIALVRILSKSDYGVFTGSFNAFYIVFLFSGLGITSGILFFCSKDIEKEDKGEYYRFSFRFGILSELFLSAALILYGVFGKVGIEETRPYIISLAGLPFIAFIYDYLSIILRAEKDNVKYARLMNLNSALYLVFGALGAMLGGIAGTIAGRYLAYIIAGIIGGIYCKDYIKLGPGRYLPKEKRLDIVKYSLKAGITSALNVLLYRLDVAVIAIVVANSAILASYKTGAALPENVNFIPQCVMIYYLPIFIQNLKDREWIKRKTREIYLFVGGISLLIGLIMIIFAPFIVKLLWGEKYLDAVPCMRILAVSFMVLSTFRTTSTNILLALKRAGYTMFVSLIAGLSNIVLDVFMTMRYGSIGAAYATLIVTILASLLSFPYVIYIIYSGKKSYE